MGPLLAGHHPRDGVVAVYPDGEGSMALVLADGSRRRTIKETFYPFFYIADPDLLRDFDRKFWMKELPGGLPLRFLCAFPGWSALRDALSVVTSHAGTRTGSRSPSPLEFPDVYVIPDPVVQYLMQAGHTQFTGMTPSDLTRMQIDLETHWDPGRRFSDPRRAADRIILIAMSDATGWEHVIDSRHHSEADMLRQMVRIVRERDPDVIEGHNFLRFDLPYIIARCKLHNVSCDLGRDGSIPRRFDLRQGQAEAGGEPAATEIAGRHILDTLSLVQSYDAVKRNMESHGLKYAARYFGLAASDRVYVEGDRIASEWESNPDTIVRYALDDVRETRALADHLSGTSFSLAQILPIPYGMVSRIGSAAKIEYLLVREYFHQRHSLPRPGTGEQTSGGYTDIFMSGVLGPVIHADVESLYPSIMLRQDIHPRSDELGVFLPILQHLTDSRLEAKAAMRRASDPVEASTLDARQSSLKILINSFYGYLGYSRGIFNDFAAADSVTSAGRGILHGLIREIQKRNGSVIEVDTDGLYFIPPAGVTSEEEERDFVAKLGATLPPGMSLAFDGRYQRMLSYKKKNYALLEYDQRLRIKGSSLTARSMERFARRFVALCIEHLLTGALTALHETYTGYVDTIASRRWTVHDFARTETLKDTVEEYAELVKAGSRPRSAAYEVALQSSFRKYRPGDRISYYVTGTDPSVRAADAARPVEEWDPNFPDENSGYYIRRLDELAEKFVVFFRPADFRRIFAPADLFPFSPEGIVVLNVPVEGQERLPSVDESPGTGGIFLDED